jgi:hypothetical protein
VQGRKVGRVGHFLREGAGDRDLHDAPAAVVVARPAGLDRPTGLPVEGVAIILAIDQFLDMGRTATNVVGNAVATSVITKWEGMLEVEEPEFVEHPHAPAHTVAAGRAGLELDESNFEDETKRG